MKNKKNFFLHIGMHKNASTYLQEYIFEKNRLGLKNFKVFTRDSNVKIFIDLIDRVVRKQISINKGKQLIKKYTKNFQNIILSQESLLGWHFDEFKNVSIRFKILEKLFNKPNYLIVYRKQEDFLFSLWKHRIRKGLKKNFKEFINCTNSNHNKNIEPKNFLTNYKIYDYNILFKSYILVKKRTIFFPYERINDKIFFIKKMKEFLKIKNMNKKFNTNRKINVSSKYELIYFFGYKNLRYINSMILNLLKCVYLVLKSLKIISKTNYKHEHFNKLSFAYLDIIELIFFNKIFKNGTNFLKNLEREKNIIRNYFEKKNLNFKKKIT
jgi:hypothetical protein